MEDSADDAGLGAAALRSELAAPNPARRAAALARAGIDPHTEQLVIEALQDPEPEVRLASVRALAKRHGQRATEALIEAAAGELSPAVRAEALGVLARILEARAPIFEPPSEAVRETPEGVDRSPGQIRSSG